MTVNEKARIALVSTPWPLFFRPSIQLGALKAYLGRELPEVPVDAHHVYLGIAHALGNDLYGQISKRSWRAESTYAALLFPERKERISRFWRRHSTDLDPGTRTDFEGICCRLEKASQTVIDAVSWQDYGLIGFSICFGQLTSALFFLRKIKEKAPLTKMVVGGSACAGEMGRSLLHAFSEINFVVRGEGERPLTRLAKSLQPSRDHDNSSPVPGILDRRHVAESCHNPRFCQIANLDRLPAPDYTDYFNQLKALEGRRKFLPEIPMEISRGCWWRLNAAPVGYKGCAFCNLNIQWKGYRAKSRERIVRELKTITERYETLSVSFVDNALPPGNLQGLFEDIARLPMDLRLFAEIRATMTRAALTAMGAAGTKQVQVGIEALSTPLLKRLNKGTTALTNLEIMKNCETPGLPTLAANLILHFPGSDQGDVDETLENLEFAAYFHPLKGIPFWLGYGSPVWLDPKGFGIQRVRNHPFYAHLFPPEILEHLNLMIKGYHGGIRYQKKLWRPVRQKLEVWREAYFQLHQTPQSDPILSYEDGGRFLIVRQRRLGAPTMLHWLKGTSREIYLFCETGRSLPHILSRFPGLGEDKTRPFLNMMVDKRLMFAESDRYLSLAVPVRGWRSCRQV